MDEMDEVIKEFLVESYENLDELDRSLVQLESNPGDRGKLAAIFRTVHTIKGTCGFLGLGKLEKVTHVGENLLSKLRDGELRLQPEITTGLLSLVDAIRHMLGNVEANGTEGDNDFADLVQTLIDLQSLRDDVATVAAPSAKVATPNNTPTLTPAVAVEPAVEPTEEQPKPTTAAPLSAQPELQPVVPPTPQVVAAAEASVDRPAGAVLLCRTPEIRRLNLRTQWRKRAFASMWLC